MSVRTSSNASQISDRFLFLSTDSDLVSADLDINSTEVKESSKKKRRSNTTDGNKDSAAAAAADGDDDDISSGPKCGTRHSLVFWAFLGFVNFFIQRVDMTITLVAMVRQNSSSPLVENVSYSDCTKHSWNVIQQSSNEKAEFEWSNTLQGLVLSSFYYGYFATQIPGSFLANRIGGKRLFVMAMAVCSVLALLTPVSARLHPGVLIANRAIQGSLQGVVFPAMQLLLSSWVTGKERSRLVAFTYAGCQAGTVFGTISAGYISDSAAGWPLVFYIEGSVGLLWCLAWWYFAFDSPHQHPRITYTEMTYLLHHVGHSERKRPPTPWRSFFRSKALYAIAAAHFANDWGCFAIMTCTPKFMKEVLHYDLSQNGILSSIPYLVMWMSNLIAGTLADFLRKPHRLKTVHVRKLMVSIGLIGPASLLLGLAYFPGCGRAPLVGMLTVAMGLSGFTIAGHSVNHLDIAPAFAGLLFAMTNSFGTTSGWIGPALAGILTEHTDKREGWQTFFLISGAVYALGGAFFVIFARGEIQPWGQFQDAEKEVTLPAPSYGSTQAQDDHVTEDKD